MMRNMYTTQFDTDEKEEKKIVLPKSEDVPVGATEKLVREEIKKLTQNADEIQKLREQIEKKAAPKEGQSNEQPSSPQ